MSTYSLSGSGTHALTAGTTGLQVSITTPSSVQGVGTANPVNHYHTGMLRFADGTAYWDPVPITGGPQFIPVPQNATSFGYSMQGGAAISVTEVIGGTVFFSGPSGAGGLYSAYLCYQDQKAQNTSGGTFTSGAWRTRDLNTELADTGNNGSVAANQITLAAGTYRVLAVCPAYDVDHHQARLQNVTDGSTLLLGVPGSAASTSNAMNPSIIQGRFTLAATKTLEVQHRCETTRATNGFGTVGNWGTEIYTTVELFKEA